MIIILVSVCTILAIGWPVHAALLLRRLHAARHCPLTGIWTRGGFETRAARLLAHHRALVVLVDGNRFKDINDVLGHATGDGVLKATATRLTEWATPGVTGRLGGDEFAAVLPLTDGADPTPLLEDLWKSLHIDTPDGGTATCSIGAVVTIQGARLSDATSAADAAMYRAKAEVTGWHLGVLEVTEPRRPGRHGTGPARP